MKLLDKRLLVIGPRTHKSGAIGGIVVSFELFLSELTVRKVAYHVIDSNKRNYRWPIVAIVAIALQLLVHVPRSKYVSLHGTAKDYVYLAPFVVLVGKIFVKRVSLRKFAGNFDQMYDGMRTGKRRLVNYALRNADVCIFQTKYLVDRFRNFNPDTYWLPNSRRVPSASRPANRPYQQRFIFVGHVCAEKGLNEIFAATSKMELEHPVSIYGPIWDERYGSLGWSRYPQVRYRGVLPVEDVSGILAEHDVLLLPSYWDGEGYPGVIIEALAVGLPVIASRLRGIEEMVTSGKEAILVSPRQPDELRLAMLSINADRYRRMSLSARERSTAFDASYVIDEFLRRCGIGV